MTVPSDASYDPGAHLSFNDIAGRPLSAESDQGLNKTVKDGPIQERGGLIHGKDGHRGVSCEGPPRLSSGAG